MSLPDKYKQASGADAGRLEQPTCAICNALMDSYDPFGPPLCDECEELEDAKGEAASAEHEPDPDRYHDSLDTQPADLASLDDSWEPVERVRYGEGEEPCTT